MIKTSITSFSIILLRISAHLIKKKYKMNNLGLTFFVGGLKRVYLQIFTVNKLRGIYYDVMPQ